MIVVYVAGKFRGRNDWEVAENVRAAERAGFEVAKLGVMPLIPHTNTAHFDGTLTPEFWVDGTKELMRRADAVYVFDKWDLDRSSGTRGEVEEAKKLAMPVFFSLVDLQVWKASDPKLRPCPACGGDGYHKGGGLYAGTYISIESDAPCQACGGTGRRF